MRVAAVWWPSGLHPSGSGEPAVTSCWWIPTRDRQGFRNQCDRPDSQVLSLDQEGSARRAEGTSAASAGLGNALVAAMNRALGKGSGPEGLGRV